MGLVEFLLSSGNIVLLFSIILIVAIFAAKSGAKFGTPTLLLFLFIGMLFGSDGLGIQFNSSNTAQFIGMLALSDHPLFRRYGYEVFRDTSRSGRGGGACYGRGVPDPLR